jgi:hypothetical protein
MELATYNIIIELCTLKINGYESTPGCVYIGGTTELAKINNIRVKLIGYLQWDEKISCQGNVNNLGSRFD